MIGSILKLGFSVVFGALFLVGGTVLAVRQFGLRGVVQAAYYLIQFRQRYRRKML